jgi:hypothetical protein
VPETRQAWHQGVDIPGAVLTVLSLAGITYGLIEGPAIGWTAPAVLALLTLGASAGLLFLVIERSSTRPMVPLGIFRRRQFTVTNALTLLVYAGLGGALFLLPVELEVVDRYSALDAGLALLPLTAIMLALSARSGRLAARIGPRVQMSAGPVVVGAGLALLALTTRDSSFAGAVLPGVLVLGLGLAATVAPLTATALGALPADHAGLASAINNDVSRVGGLVAVAVLPALAGIGGTAYLHGPTMASGFRVAVYVTAIWCAAGGLLAAVGIRNPPQRPQARGTACTHCALDASPASAGAGR